MMSRQQMRCRGAARRRRHEIITSRFPTWVWVLTKGEKGPRKPCPELTMPHVSPLAGDEVEEGLVDIDLPEANALAEVTVIPAVRAPHIGH